jgi:hypothetical protein
VDAGDSHHKANYHRRSKNARSSIKCGRTPRCDAPCLVRDGECAHRRNRTNKRNTDVIGVADGGKAEVSESEVCGNGGDVTPCPTPLRLRSSLSVKSDVGTLSSMMDTMALFSEIFL